MMSPSAASSSSRCGIVDERDPGRVRPEDDAGEHEERDRRQPDAAPEAREDPGREERAAERDELVTHRRPQPTTWRTKPRRSSCRPTTTSRSPACSTSIGSGATIGSEPRRIAATVIFVRRRISRSAMLRPTPGESSCERDPVDQQVADDGFDVLDDRGLEVRAREHGAQRAGLRVGERQRRARLAAAACGSTYTSRRPEWCTTTHTDAAFDRFELVAHADARAASARRRWLAAAGGRRCRVRQRDAFVGVRLLAGGRRVARSHSAGNSITASPLPRARTRQMVELGRGDALAHGR